MKGWKPNKNSAPLRRYGNPGHDITFLLVVAILNPHGLLTL